MAKRKKKSSKSGSSYASRVHLPVWFVITLITLVIIAGAGYTAYYLYQQKERARIAALDSSSASTNVPSTSQVVSNSSTEGSASATQTSASASSVTASSAASSTTPVAQEDGIVENIVYDNFKIMFMELGVYNAGDCIYIKAGQTDVIIDAGPSYSAANESIKPVIDQYCTDNKIEYIIATHAHSDHITGMVGTTAKPGFLTSYSIGTIIDFALTNATSTIYKNYESAVDTAVGNSAVHYTAAQCWNQTDGAQREYVLDATANITMDILYNKYYFEKSTDENNYSVCTMFNYGSHHYLLTGDLEVEGETALSEYYDGSTAEKTLPQVDLFKAGHHGSYTASNNVLLNMIKPKMCCVCCCAGGSEYTANYLNTFPSQDFVDRIAKYTSRVYVTSQFDEDATRQNNENTFKAMNGRITVSSDGTSVGLSATNNLTRLKNTDWFKQTVYVVYDSKNNPLICSGIKQKDYYTASTAGAVAKTRRIWPSYGV